MQLDGATELERRTYDTCLRVERELPAGDLATTVVVALSEAGQELQRLRGELGRLDASVRVVELLTPEARQALRRHFANIGVSAWERFYLALAAYDAPGQRE